VKILKVEGIDILLDDWDWLRLCKYKWRIKDNGQGHKSVVRSKWVHRKCLTIYMHRDIMETPDNMETHHKLSVVKTLKKNVIDNRKEMLENMTRQEHTKLHQEGQG